MKKSENVVSSASSGGQSNQGSSSTGNSTSRIIWGFILLIKHITTFTFYFQSDLICISSKKYIFQLGQINVLEFVAFCTNAIQKMGRSQEERRVGQSIL